MVRPRPAFGSLVTATISGCTLAAGAIIAATAALADWSPVSGRVLTQMVPGSTVVIDAPMGFKLPIQHADDGSMTGEAGGLSFYLGSSTDTGRWWVAGDKLCYKWARWFKSESRCMKIRRDGTRIEWEKDDGETGTAAMTLRKSPPAEQIADANPPASKPLAPAVPRIAASAPTATAVPAAKSAPALVAKSATVAAMIAAPPKAAPDKTATRAPSPAAPKIATAAPPVRAASMVPLRAPAPPVPAANAPPGGSRVAMQQTTPPYRVGGPPAPAYRVVSVAFDDVLNVRQGPSQEHPAIAALEPEARGVRMIGPCQGDWCFVRHEDIVGWVNRYYLEEIPGR